LGISSAKASDVERNLDLKIYCEEQTKLGRQTQGCPLLLTFQASLSAAHLSKLKVFMKV